MNGAESLAQTLSGAGVELCFANPGTSEIHFVAALEKTPIRAVLCLFEGVVTGAADGYGRMAGKPAIALLHLGPGFANGIANLHNARKAGSPVLNIVGDHASSHVKYDAPLTSDILGICRTVSHWLHSTNAMNAAAHGAQAVAAALAAPGRIATLILPADAAWSEGSGPKPALPVAGPAPVAGDTIEQIARALSNGKRSALLLRGAPLTAPGVEAAGRIAAKSGCRLLHDYFTPRVTRGAGLPEVERIPYFAEEAVTCLAGLEQLILVGAAPPVSFFAYPDKPSWLTPAGCEILYLSQPDENGIGALAALADALGARESRRLTLVRPEAPRGVFDSFAMGQAIARFMPEGAIISDDSLTAGGGLDKFTRHGPRHDILYLTGGAIGDAMPVATGAALACPQRKVIAVSGDGAAMYTLQALWTQAREKLDITTVICANRSYAILNRELTRVGAIEAGPKTLAMLDLHDPAPDWVALGRGMGVESTRATTAEEFSAQFEDAMAHKGPRLIEAVSNA